MDQSIKSFVNNYLEQYDLKSKGEATEFNKSVQIDYSNFFKTKDFTEFLIKELKADNDNLKSSLSAKQVTGSANPIKEDNNSLITVRRNKKLEEEHIQLLFEFPEEAVTQKEEYVKIPQYLNRKQLGKRFGLSEDTISRNRNNVKWTKEKDPDGIAWIYCEETKYFSPLNEPDL